jgi:hypothetical protein
MYCFRCRLRICLDFLLSSGQLIEIFFVGFKEMLEAPSGRGPVISKKQPSKQNSTGQSRHASGLPVTGATASGAAGKLNQADGIVKPSGVTGSKIRRALARFNLLPAINVRYVNNESKTDSLVFFIVYCVKHISK